MNPTHYLRVEGVNLDNFVLDTRDLSTTRGGSLLLLDAIPAVIETLKSKVGEDKLRVLSQGASSGLFEIETSDPAGIARAVREKLASDTNWRHATFVVDVVPVSNGFRTDVEAVLSANRWRQMQASSLAVPPKNSSPVKGKPACGLDWLRPAEPGGSDTHNVRGERVSDSVSRRHRYGREAKQKFYEKKTGLSQLPNFAKDFETIAGAKSKDRELLTGKLAVFYADGNNFGKHQTNHCDGPDKQSAWDNYIRQRREAFLKAFLEEVVKEPGDWQDSGTARFETLLWGGDEVMFVMPARLGWRFAAFFFDKMGTLNLKDAGAGLPDERLTHAAALVFCQHHSPIHRIKRLAKEQMAEFAKGLEMDDGKGRKLKIGRDRNSLVVAVLESFDHLGTDYEAAMRKRYRDAVSLSDMILAENDASPLACRLREIARHLNVLRASETFPRSQLRALVNAMLENPGEAATLAAFGTKKQETSVRVVDHAPPAHFRNASEEEQVLLWDQLRPLFANPQTLWMQLEELWDYALP